MENHSKYGDTIYFHTDDSLFVNLFIASQLNWTEKNVIVRQETQFPENDTTTLKITTKSPQKFALKIRHPEGAADGVKVSINGRSQKIQSTPGSYFAIDREWRDGDTVKIQLPMKLHTEFLPNTTNEVALLYGPVVLAGELGTNNMPNVIVGDQNRLNRTQDPVAPVLVTTAANLLKHVKPVSGKELKFRTSGIGQPEDITLIPFYQVHRERYSVYWKVISESDWKAQSAAASSAN